MGVLLYLAKDFIARLRPQIVEFQQFVESLYGNPFDEHSLKNYGRLEHIADGYNGHGIGSKRPEYIVCRMGWMIYLTE